MTSLAKEAFSYHGSLATEGVPMLHVWFRSCPVANSAQSPFAHMFSSTKDYTVTDADMANASVTIHVPRAQASAGSPNWNTYAGQWQALADASMAWKTDATKKVFSLPDAPDGETVWVTDWRKTGNTDNDAAVRVVFWDDPVQVEVSGPEYEGSFVRRDYTTAEFTAMLKTYDTEGADHVTLSVTLYTDSDKTQVAQAVSQNVSALGVATAFSFAGLLENTTYYAALSGVDSEGGAGDVFDLGSFTTKWEDTAWTHYPDRGTLEKGWIVVKNVTADGTALSIANDSNNGDTEIPDLDFTNGIRNGYELVSVGNNAFQGCTALTNAVLPDTVTRIGDRAFYECPALANFVAEGLVAIASYAFNADGKTSSLWTVSIPNVVEIGDRAFKSNTLLETLGSDLHALRSLGYQEALANLPNLEGDFVLTNLVSIGGNSWTFNGDKKVTSIVLGPGVSTWPVRTFSGMTGLTNLVFQGAVTSFGNYAILGHGPYGGATETLHVYLTSVPESFGDNVFGDQFWADMSKTEDDAALVVVHIPWYAGAGENKEESDGSTTEFAKWARQWQGTTASTLTDAGCTTTRFELPASKDGLGVWRNDVNNNSGAFAMRVAYYRDPNLVPAMTILILR
ncbi:MAG: leucine-rich repeat domain-containing protein [Kiritimatiellae bacterium]|nr:leucine-rich repeat domain-containing protein [Kiritimatiellia bacterium]